MSRLTGYRVAILMISSTVWAQEPPTAPTQPPAPPPLRADELAPCPPPLDACAEDIVAHVLTDPVGSWQRVGVPVSGDPALLTSLPAEARESFPVYDPLCGAEVVYRNTTGPGSAVAAMIAFGSRLDALGFFAAQRTERARRVLLTSAAYRDEGVLHVYSGWYYIRVEVTDAQEQALAPDQYLAARLEVRLPQQVEIPRIIRIMPRGWVNALTVSYEPTDLLGRDVRPMAAGASRMVGEADVRVRLMEAGDPIEARRWYTLLLQEALDRGTAWEVARLGTEGFFAENGRLAVGMLQDQFVAHLTTNGTRLEAEAIMRLVGTAIRITRPLPGDELCPAPQLRANGD